MIATLAEIKQILNIGNTDQDDRINFFSPIVEEEIHEICRNYFIRQLDLDNQKYNINTTISFENSSYKISDSENGMDAFISGNSIKVIGSLENDGIYEVDTVAGDGSYLTIDSSQSLTDEAAGESIKIYKLWYPKSLKLPFAYMINYKLSEDVKAKNTGVKSEKIDDYSITYNGDSGFNNNYGYPNDIMKMLSKYAKFYKC